jgi:hypothetical protein
MRFVLMLAAAAVAIAYFSHKVSTDSHRDGKSPQASISAVNDLMSRAAAGGPLDGRAAPDRRWVASMIAACEKRERLLARLPRGTSADGIAARGERILAIQRGYAARVAALRPSAAYAAEGREIRGFNASQERILQRVIALARAGDLARATQEAVALRELAGRANAVFLRLGLDRCALGGSGMPL